MNAKDLKHFKEVLLKVRFQIMNGSIINNNEDLYISEEDLSDEGDLATSMIQQNITCTIKERERFKIKAIDMALEKISEGTYGHCEDCADEIGLKRLETQPWTEYCIFHAEEKEREAKKRFKSG